MATLKKIGKAFVTVLICLVFAMSVVAVIASIAQRNTGVPGAFGYSFAIVESPSMEPFLNIGDVAVGKIVNADTVINVDDVVTYNSIIQNIPVTITHRVTEVTKIGNETYYQTWGDNRESNPVPDDGYRTNEDIVSVYVGKVAGLGKFINFIKEPIGFILVLVVPLALFVLYEIFSLFRIYFNAKKEELAEGAPAPGEATDEMKEAIIQEYLKKKAAEEAALKAAGAKEGPDGNTPAGEGGPDNTGAEDGSPD